MSKIPECHTKKTNEGGVHKMKGQRYVEQKKENTRWYQKKNRVHWESVKRITVEWNGKIIIFCKQKWITANFAVNIEAEGWSRTL